MVFPPKKTLQPPSKKQFKSKREDSFWPIVIILAIICFTASFWVFYMLTNNINTKTFNTSEVPTLMLTPSPSTAPSTIVIGEGQNPSPSETPSGSVSATPSPSRSPSKQPSKSPSPSISATPTATPTLKPTPSPSKTPVPKPTVAQKKDVTYRVQVGSFGSRDEAQKTANELADLGYSIVVVEEGGSYHVQLGSYPNQERALSLAEEVTQKGYSVVVKQLKR